ncbi:MAG: YeeE/YedE family protein [Rhizobacter sp.]|nr:YeeE/YedE family protein [Burkholderiales bacterium]
MMHPYTLSLLGGLLIGVSVWLMLVGLGRVTGVSGIAATALTEPRSSLWRFAFLLGLIGGGAVFAQVFNLHGVSITSRPWLIGAGLLVGLGTVIGGGCTSGHGVCGLGRRSLRSLVATLTFMAAGMLTVAVIQAVKGASA